MLTPLEEKGFKKDLRRIKKRSKNIDKLKLIVRKLIYQEKLPLKYYNHKLTGNYKGFYECHIEPDWLLIYKLTTTNLILVRTGSHADLF